jgi:CRP-like cAMP-binding protein
VSKNIHNLVGNKLLAAVPREEYERLVPNLEAVSLSFKQYLYEPNEPIEYIYFPKSGVVSVLTVMEDGGTVEVATVGNEGMIGIHVLLGADRVPTETFVQVPAMPCE